MVQGVGFRPFVYVTASGLGLTGSVVNTATGVTAEVEGPADDVATFGRLLVEQPPPLAVVESVHATDRTPVGGTGFRIGRTEGGGPARTLASPDVAICADCLAELTDPANRRYRHPFITCTHCGPRFTIITALPYDRAGTTMADFAMCDRCRAEYDDPADRRFHAQPIACHACGPRLKLVVRGGDEVRGPRHRPGDPRPARGRRDGGHQGARRLPPRLRRDRRAGRRPAAPPQAARRQALRGDGPRRRRGPAAGRPLARRGAAAQRPRAPVLLLRRAPPRTPVRRPWRRATPTSASCCPTRRCTCCCSGSATSPAPDLLVMTSGNLSGEPIVTDDEDAAPPARRRSPTPGWCTTAAIQVPCDDSVARFVGGAELPVRRSRGYAPLPIALPFDVAPMLAVGADLKNTCAVGRGPLRLGQPAHRGPGRPAPPSRRSTRTERHLRDAHRRPARPVGRPTRTPATGPRGGPARSPGPGAHGAAPPRPRGLRDGRARAGPRAGHRVRLRRHRLRRPTAQCGAASSWSATTRRAAARRTSAMCRWRAATPACAAPTGWRSRTCGPPASTGTRPARGRRLPRHRAGRARPPARHRVRLRADLEHGPALRRGVLAGRRPPRRRLRGRGGDRAGGAGPAGGRRGPLPRSTSRPGPEPTVADPGPVVRAVVADVRRGMPAALVAARFHAGVAALVVALAERERERTGLERWCSPAGCSPTPCCWRARSGSSTGAGSRCFGPGCCPPTTAASRSDRSWSARRADHRRRQDREERCPCVWQFQAASCHCTSRTDRRWPRSTSAGSARRSASPTSRTSGSTSTSSCTWGSPSSGSTRSRRRRR